jgi:hypothetical protein
LYEQISDDELTYITLTNDLNTSVVSRDEFDQIPITTGASLNNLKVTVNGVEAGYWDYRIDWVVEKTGFSPTFSVTTNPTVQTNLLQKNVSSKRTVLDYLGSPTIYFKLNNKEHFLYFSEEIKYFLFFKPKAVDRKILLITFDNLDTVKDLEFYNLNNENKDFKFSNETTKIKHNNNLVDYFIENISKFGS